MKRISLFLFLLAALTSCSPRVYSDFTFVQMSDPQIGFRDKSPGFVHTDSLFDLAVKEVNLLKPSCVIITGDLINDQRDMLQDSIYRANRAKIEAPVYEVPGNHDIRPWTADNHSNYLNLRGSERFSFRLNGCAFIGIDSNCIVENSDEERGEGKQAALSEEDRIALTTAEEEQLKWLKRELKKARKCRYTFVFLHCPVILETIAEENGYFNFPKGKRAEYIALFKKYGVAAVFAGHTHMKYNTQAEGIRFVTAGPVGSPLGRGYSGYEVINVTKNGFSTEYKGTVIRSL